MNEPPILKKCSACGADNAIDNVECWLCGKSLESTADTAVGSASQSRPVIYATAVHPNNPAVSGQMGLATIFLIMTLCAVIMALIVAAPGLGILLAIFSTPPLIRTLLVVTQRKQSGQQVSPGKKVLLFLGSLGTTTVVACLAVCSSIGTFCGICLSSGQDSAIPIAALAALITTAVTFFVCGKWIIKRWRRDTRTN